VVQQEVHAVWVMDTHVHLALALAVTYPNHYPASCWTNNHFVYKENYINSLCHIVRLLTSFFFCIYEFLMYWRMGQMWPVAIIMAWH